MRQFRALKWRLVPLALAAVILCIPFVNGALSRHDVNLAAHAAQTKLDKNSPNLLIEGQPSRILIPSLAIDLPVISQSYSKLTRTWPVAPDVANYATETSPANNLKSQTLIYGHDTRNVFGPLAKLKPGDKVYVYTANGHIFKYSYLDAEDVMPSAVLIINDMANAPVGLKLITCSGDYFQYRRVMTLKLVQAA